MTRARRLSKSRFTSGVQCHRQLWWKVHEPEAAEAEVDPGQQALFDRGSEVGELAQSYVPGGLLIDFPYRQYEKKVAATRKAIDDGKRVIYEASFNEDSVFVAVDILERVRSGWALVEVKSTTKVKPQHIPDLAVQAHVLGRAGLDVRRMELMHLNRECRYPNLTNLFTRADVTADVEDFPPERA